MQLLFEQRFLRKSTIPPSAFCRQYTSNLLPSTTKQAYSPQLSWAQHLLRTSTVLPLLCYQHHTFPLSMQKVDSCSNPPRSVLRSSVEHVVLRSAQSAYHACFPPYQCRKVSDRGEDECQLCSSYGTSNRTGPCVWSAVLRHGVRVKKSQDKKRSQWFPKVSFQLEDHALLHGGLCVTSWEPNSPLTLRSLLQFSRQTLLYVPDGRLLPRRPNGEYLPIVDNMSMVLPD